MPWNRVSLNMEGIPTALWRRSECSLQDMPALCRQISIPQGSALSATMRSFVTAS